MAIRTHFSPVPHQKISTAGQRSTTLNYIKTYILILYYNYFCLNMVNYTTKYSIKSNFFSLFFKKVGDITIFGNKNLVYPAQHPQNCLSTAGQRSTTLNYIKTYILILYYNYFCLNMVNYTTSIALSQIFFSLFLKKLGILQFLGIKNGFLSANTQKPITFVLLGFAIL